MLVFINILQVIICPSKAGLEYLSHFLWLRQCQLHMVCCQNILGYQIYCAKDFSTFTQYWERTILFYAINWYILVIGWTLCDPSVSGNHEKVCIICRHLCYCKGSCNLHLRHRRQLYFIHYNTTAVSLLSTHSQHDSSSFITSSGALCCDRNFL